jgi:hypothetical protein
MLKLREKAALAVQMDAQMVEHTAAVVATDVRHLLTVVALAAQSVSSGPAQHAHSHQLVRGISNA